MNIGLLGHYTDETPRGNFRNVHHAFCRSAPLALAVGTVSHRPSFFGPVFRGPCFSCLILVLACRLRISYCL